MLSALRYLEVDDLDAVRAVLAITGNSEDAMMFLDEIIEARRGNT